jgi:hypothetical protein
MLNQYKNIKEKFFKMNAVIWCNKTSRKKQLTANYILNKINGNNRQCLNTIKAAAHHRLNQKLNF